MITAIQMITDALRLANIIDEIQAPNAEQASSGLRSLNQLLADWEEDGVRLGWHVVAAQDDVLPLADADERGVKYNFSCELCGEYGIEPSARVAQIANDTYARLAKSSTQEVVADLSSLPGEDANTGMSWPMG